MNKGNVVGGLDIDFAGFRSHLGLFDAENTFAGIQLAKIFLALIFGNYGLDISAATIHHTVLNNKLGLLNHENKSWKVRCPFVCLVVVKCGSWIKLPDGDIECIDAFIGG